VRRPLTSLALAATVAASLPSPGFSTLTWRPAPPETSHASRASKLARKVVAYARRQVGVPYRYGGASTSTGFDCSGLVYASYRSIGRKIPHSSWEQLHLGRPVRFGRLRPGDLVFTEGGGHVVLVVSKRAAISAPQTGERVRYVALGSLRSQFAGARRLLG
jgi:peptidoglycan DL-endopeptidase CwlO